jgi:hypothetical protein
MGIKKESNMFNSANKQNPKMKRGKRKKQIGLKKINTITGISKHLSIITLRVSGLNSPIGRQT